MITPQFIMGYVVPLSGPPTPPRPRPPITIVKGELDDNGNARIIHPRLGDVRVRMETTEAKPCS